MLPDFPILKKQRLEKLMKEARKRALGRHGYLEQIAGHQTPEGNDFSAKSISGDIESSGFQKLSAGGTLDDKTVVNYEDSDWVAYLDSAMIGPLVDQMATHFLQAVEQATTSSGNVIKSGGNPFSEDVFLSLLRKISISFDVDGTPHMPSIIVSPSQSHLLDASEPSNAFLQRRNEIIEHKRLEWRLEQSDRKLVD